MSRTTSALLLTKTIHKVQTKLHQNPTSFNDLVKMGLTNQAELGQTIGHMLSTGMINATFYINTPPATKEVQP